MATSPQPRPANGRQDAAFEAPRFARASVSPDRFSHARPLTRVRPKPARYCGRLAAVRAYRCFRAGPLRRSHPATFIVSDDSRSANGAEIVVHVLPNHASRIQLYGRTTIYSDLPQLTVCGMCCRLNKQRRSTSDTETSLQVLELRSTTGDPDHRHGRSGSELVPR
jgi:hypothetical protein